MLCGRACSVPYQSSLLLIDSFLYSSFRIKFDLKLFGLDFRKTNPKCRSSGWTLLLAPRSNRRSVYTDKFGA